MQNHVILAALQHHVLLHVHNHAATLATLAALQHLAHLNAVALAAAMTVLVLQNANVLGGKFSKTKQNATNATMSSFS